MRAKDAIEANPVLKCPTMIPTMSSRSWSQPSMMNLWLRLFPFACFYVAVVGRFIFQLLDN